MRLCRKEWRYALHSARLDPDESDECSPNPAAADPFGEPTGVQCVSYAELREAIAALPPASRELIEQVFWNERKEAELAKELAISQQAVSKRRRAILRKLGEALDPSTQKIARHWL